VTLVDFCGAADSRFLRFPNTDLDHQEKAQGTFNYVRILVNCFAKRRVVELS